MWPSGQRVGLAIQESWVQVPLWPLAGFVLGLPEFKSLAIANWLPPASWGYKSCYVVFELFVSKYLSGVPVNYLDKLSVLSTKQAFKTFIDTLVDFVTVT